MTIEKKIINTSTLAGLKKAERLQSFGWKVEGINSITNDVTLTREKFNVNELIHIWFERYYYTKEGRKLDVVAINFIDNFLLAQYDPINSLEYE